MNPSTSAALLAFLALGLACASTEPPIVSQQEIESARAGERLGELYDRLESELASLAPTSAAPQRARLAEVGMLLAGKLDGRLSGELDSNRLAGGRVSLAVLDRLARASAPLARWASPDADRWSSRLAEEERKTRRAIAAEQQRLDESQSDDRLLDRLAALERLQTLFGPGAEASGFAAQRTSALEALGRLAAEAIENENYRDAQALLRTAHAIDPTNASLGERLADVDGRLLEQSFWKALEERNPDNAFEVLQRAATSKDFPRIRERLQPSAQVMAEYFGELAATATAQSRLADAYHDLQRADTVAGLFGRSKTALAPRRAFGERMLRESKSAGSPAATWGFLRLAEEFSQATPDVRRRLREARERVERGAVRRLSALPFEDANHHAAFGEAVGGRIVEFLMEAIPHDVRIIEREQLSEILREKEIAAAGEGAGARLASADFLVQGSILEAKVDSSESEGRKTVRVMTGTKTVANPEYPAWAALGEPQRAGTPEPSRTISIEKHEDVTIRLTAHRKVGILAASYRVIDAVSAKVLLADSVRVKEKVQDESSEGVELGDFRMEFKLANLPSDLEILNELADRVSKTIGERLATFLGNAETEYVARASELEDEGDFGRATDLFAAALVIAEQKSNDVDGLLARLKQSTLAHADSSAPASN